jgi:hypothetical protein
MSKWETGNIRITTEEYDAIKLAAKNYHMTVSAFLYAILHNATKGFTNWDCLPDVMPRGYVTRNPNKDT